MMVYIPVRLIECRSQLELGSSFCPQAERGMKRVAGHYLQTLLTTPRHSLCHKRKPVAALSFC